MNIEQLLLLAVIVLIALAKILLRGRFGYDAKINISEEYTEVRNVTSGNIFKLQNIISYKIINGKKNIIAVGGPENWPKNAPKHLPDDTHTIYLIENISDAIGWGHFIRYCWHKSVMENRQFMWRGLRCWAKAIIVNISLSDQNKTQKLVRTISKNSIVPNIKILKT